MKSKFYNSREALKVWEAGKAEREKLWDDAVTDADIAAAQKADNESDLKVQQAFHKDTKEFNSLDSCKLVSPWKIKMIVSPVRKLKTQKEEERPK